MVAHDPGPTGTSGKYESLRDGGLVATSASTPTNREQNPAISVVIPFYNAWAFFPAALESVRRQTLPPLEVIVVNDGCGDAAGAFLAQYDGITVIDLHENGGVSRARNAGIERARGEWVAFLDADDLWAPDKLARQLAFLAQNPVFDACHTGVETFSGDTVLATYNDKPRDLALADLLRESHVTPSSLLVRRRALRSVGGFDPALRCSEDHDLSIRLVQDGTRIGFLPSALTRLRREGHGHLSASGRRLLRAHLQLLVRHGALFAQHGRSRRRFLSSAFLTAGGKARGAERKLYFALGRGLAWISRDED